MQKIYMILSLLILIGVVIFAYMNDAGVTVNLLGFSQVETNVAVLILICFTAGVVLMGLFDLGRSVRKWSEIRHLKKDMKSLEEERDLLKNRVDELNKNPSAEKDLGNGNSEN